MAPIVLGMDIGGTKSHAVLADETGKILGEGVGGAGNINFISLELAQQSFTEAITAAQQQAGIDKLQTEIAIIAIEPQVDPLIPCIQRLARPKQVLRRAEGECSLVGGLVEKVGVALIAGTGSVGWGRNAQGRTHVTSCWGPIGDEGSGYWLSEQGINAAFMADDGRGPTTRMVGEIIKKIGGQTLRECVTPLYTSQDFRKEVSQYARIVIDLATANPPDEVMKAILDKGAEHLAHILATCMKYLAYTLGPTRWPLPARWLPRTPAISSRCAAVCARHSEVQMLLPRFSPGVGAVLIALDLIGVEWTDRLVANLGASTYFTSY